MVSFQQEEVPLTAEDGELPDMVPVSIRGTVPELQNCSLERVLAGLLLTWKEFLQLFDVRVDGPDFYIRGSNGTKSDLNQKIGDYVNTFRRKLKIYPVTLERETEVAEMARGQRVSTNSEGSNPTKPVDSRAPKKLKLMDEDKRKKSHRNMAKSLEKIAQSVIKEQVVSAPKRNNGKRGDGKRDSVKSRSPTPPTTSNKIDGQSTSSDVLSMGTVVQGESIAQTSRGKLKRLSSDHIQVKEFALSSVTTPSSSSAMTVVKRGRKPRKSRTLSSRRSTKESMNSASANTAVSQDSNEESSESDGDYSEGAAPPSRSKRKLLKYNVIQFLREKVSPRSFLRLRSELMALRDQEKYFKVTFAAPMTAGMMEQTFCRKLAE